MNGTILSAENVRKQMIKLGSEEAVTAYLRLPMDEQLEIAEIARPLPNLILRFGYGGAIDLLYALGLFLASKELRYVAGISKRLASRAGSTV